jgi:hypothetical protein
MKDIESRFEGCANKREILDAIEETIIEQLEEYNPRVYEYLQEKAADYPNIIITLEPKFQMCQDTKGVLLKKRFIGYDVKVSEAYENN